MIACAGYSERVLFLIEGAVKTIRSGRWWCSANASTNGFVSSAIEAGAEDLLALPETPDGRPVRLQKAMARKRGAAAATGGALCSTHLRARPEGRHRQDARPRATSPSRSRDGGGGRRRSSTSICSSATSASALGIAPELDGRGLARSGGTLDSAKLESTWRSTSPGCAVLLAPTRPDQASVDQHRVPARALLDVATHLRLRRRRHAARVHARGDLVDRRLVAHLHGRDARLAVVEEHEARARDPRPDGLRERERVSFVLNRADTQVGITPEEDVAMIVGGRPDILVPSDRQIPISVNEGTPIVARWREV